jgi:mono/diheme cytochrome c family protein
MIPQFVIDKMQTVYPKWSPTMYKATLLGAIAMAIIIPLALVATPMIEFFNGMAAQPKGKAQGTYGRVFGEELIVERPPVPGTIPRGYVRYAFAESGNTIEDALLVGETLLNPVPLDRAGLERGRRVYEIFCAVCHGKEGHGDGPATGPNRFPAPPSLHTDQARDYADGTMFHIITKGVGKMPGYARQIDPDDRWKTIHFVRALQRAMNPKPEDMTP